MPIIKAGISDSSLIADGDCGTLTDVSEERRLKAEQLAANLKKFKATVALIRAHLPEEEKKRLKERKRIMTPERDEAFDRNLLYFLDRMSEIQGKDLADYVRGNADRRRAVGLKIRDGRKHSGYKTQKALADHLGLAVDTIGRVENGANVRTDTLSKIYNATYISLADPIDFLLDRDREWFLEKLDSLSAARDDSGADIFGFSDVEAPSTHDEQELLELWRRAPKGWRSALLGIIKLAIPDAKPQDEREPASKSDAADIEKPEEI